MNVLLYGHNPAPSIVAAQQLDDSHIRLYKRRDEEIVQEDVEFFPFLFLSQPSFLAGYDRKHWLKDLAGSNSFRTLAVFTRWSDLWEAIRIILEKERTTTARRLEGYTDAESLHVRPDPVGQYLMQSGSTLFKGMEFTDLRRMQISVLTGPPSRSARAFDEPILAVALSDTTGWEIVLDAHKSGEAGLLAELTHVIRERDPDVLEGHRIFEHDLAVLLRRSDHHERPLSIGRDGSEARLLQGRWAGQESDHEASLADIAGRHVVDTSLLAEVYDFSRRSLDSLDLGTLATHFGASGRRVQFSGHPAFLWKEDPRRAHTLVLQNVHDIRLISDYLSPSSFYLTQMVPLSYGVVARTGSAVKIESLLLREYLRQKHSVPRPGHGTQTTGGYADVFLTGVFEKIVLADVESLYPSIILQRNIRPATDELGIFSALLRDLVALRLEAKRSMAAAATVAGRAKLDALQSSFKILINSFYGYLAYSRALFNDFAKADEITKTGQALLRKILGQIELHNGQVVEVDTDGVYFIAPDNVEGVEAETLLVDRISSSLPEGIELIPSGRYRKMLSYKKKNYALLGYDGTLTIRGSALVSRSMERFLRRFLRLAVSNLLDENIAGLHTLYATFHSDIAHHRWEALDFCRTETIHDPFSVYEREIGEGKRNPAAAYEVARRAGRIVKPGEKVSYYVTGTSAGVKVSENCRLAEEWDPHFPDENTAYYLGRLEETAAKFEIFFNPEDFRKIFTVDDLFGFDPAGVRIVTRRMVPEEAPPSPDPQETDEFRIWLGES
ncbi:MAG: DNA polymerase [Bacteroidia bacterium]|nr:MAG: DNA polymerase [Bacteroidia bacterium]